MEDILKKYDQLVLFIKELGSAAVAFSGGVDSTLLVMAAKEALSDKVIAYTVKSGFITENELFEAKMLAEQLKVTHRIIYFDEGKIEGLCENPRNRCYICKKAIMKVLKYHADCDNLKSVIEGSNIDDMSDYRPGMQAVKEEKIISPLLEKNLTKAEIREILKVKGITAWNKPSMPCLASRIPYGEFITKEKINMVSMGEKKLSQMGFLNVRVRHHGEIARIEVMPEDIHNITKSGICGEISEYFKKIGFKYVTLDLSGYKMGNLNN